MKKQILFIILFFTFYFGNISIKAADNDYRVLILFSYTYNYPSFDSQIEGIRSVFDMTGIYYDIEFLDAKRFPLKSIKSMRGKSISKKVINLPPYDAVLTCDEDALYFALNLQKELFNNIPIVFCAVNDIDFALRQDSAEMVTGIAEVVSMKETIIQMHKMFPNTNDIYAISDVTTQGASDLRDYIELRDELPELNLKYYSLADYSYTELSERLSEIPSSVPILYLACYRDRDGNTLSFDESVHYINKYVQSPVFHLWYQGVDKPGMIGGKVLTFYYQGHYAANLVYEILHGKEISAVKVNVEDNNIFTFDYNELKRFNIDESQIPEGSIILNKPITAFEKHKLPIIFLSSIIFLLGILVFFLVRYNVKKKKMMRQLEITKDELQLNEKILEKSYGELVIANNKAVESDKMKSVFLANMSHEIRTPLNAIIGFSNILINDTLTQEEKENCINIINTNSDLLLNLINDILDISKLESGTAKFNRKYFDFSPFFDNIIKSVAPKFENTPIKLISDNPYKKCIVYFDETRVLQVINNFITNAYKYTEKGYIKVGYHYEDGGIKVYVEDTGKGIDENMKEKIFNRFEKLDSFAQGVGLGLAISKALAEDNGGKIGCESKKGVGSTFWFWKATSVEIE